MRGGPKEILVACARENRTLGVCYRSFTSVLIDELRAMKQQPFNVTLLYSRLLTGRGRLASTPIHASLSDKMQPSIILAPLPKAMPLSSTTDDSLATSSEHPSESRFFPEDSSHTPATSISTLDEPRVLLSLGLSDKEPLNISEWVKWLNRESPQAITDVVVQIEGAFKSYSTLLLVSIPLPVWDRLPDREAYGFVGFVMSKNLLEFKQNASQGAQELGNIHKSPLLFWQSDGSPESSEFAGMMSRDLEQHLPDPQVLKRRQVSMPSVVDGPESTRRRLGTLQMFGVYWVSEDLPAWRETHCYLFTEFLMLLGGNMPLLQQKVDGAPNLIQYHLEAFVDRSLLLQVISNTGRFKQRNSMNEFNYSFI